jgi:hypothetical protein
MMMLARSAFVVLMLALAVMAQSARAGERAQRDAKACLVQVLYSEMLPAAPPFYHTVKARLLVTPADRPPFETSVVRTIPWQAPPPRQGQRLSMSCDAVQADSGFRLF